MNTRRHRTDLISIAGLALLLSACGAATPGTTAAPRGAPTPTPNAQLAASAASAPTANPVAVAPSSAASGGACAILDKAAVSQATGFVVTQTNGTDAICYYQSADESQYLVVTLFGDQADMATILQIEPGSDHVADLGDDAFWAAAGGILFVRKGDRGIELLDPGLSAGTDATASRDAMVGLARAALPSV